MRFKKQKRHRKAVRFYTTCFGFREPFKVLCDGTFVHHLLSNQILPADAALAKVLGGRVKVFTTRCVFFIESIIVCFFLRPFDLLFFIISLVCRCVLLELKALGPSYSKAFEAASNLSTARSDTDLSYYFPS